MLFFELAYTNEISGNLQVYWNYGQDLSEEKSTTLFIESTTEDKASIFPINAWGDNTRLAAIRIDPPNGSKFTIKKLLILEIEIQVN